MEQRSRWERACQRPDQRREKSGHEKGKKRDRRLLTQLIVCTVLFLTVFAGRGVFPQQIRQAGDRLLEAIGRSTDFSAVFADLGDSLSDGGSPLLGLEEFCTEVFGAKKPQAVPTAVSPRIAPGEEYLWAGDQSEPVQMARRLRLDEVPREWIEETPVSTEAETVEEETAAPAVGTVLVSADYTGTPLPEGYTMDQLSLGGLETATPVMGTMWSPYGYRKHPVDGKMKFHNGVDLGAATGTPIGAFADGTVEYIGESDIHGLYLQLDHGAGVKSFYAHCSRVLVQQGQQVKLGETVAEVGSTGCSTGPHLHFEIKCAGRHVNPSYYIQYRLPA